MDCIRKNNQFLIHFWMKLKSFRDCLGLSNSYSYNVDDVIGRADRFGFQNFCSPASWSSSASHMILSRKMLKRVGDSRHPCRTPTVVLNHSPVLPLNRTALWALSYRFPVARMMLALMLYFFIVAHKASCYTLSKVFLAVYEDMVEILLMLQVFLAEDPEIEFLFCGAPSGSETCLLFSNDLFCLWLQSV